MIENVDILRMVVPASVGIFIAAYMRHLDKKRRDAAELSHKKIIKTDLGRINDIIGYITYKIRNIKGENNADETYSSLNQHMERYHARMESLIQDIRIQHAHCNELKPNENKMIERAIESAQWILDKYYRPDIAESSRMLVWSEHHDKLHEHAKAVVQAAGKLS